MNTENETAAAEQLSSKKLKTQHLEQELDGHDPYDHEALASEPS